MGRAELEYRLNGIIDSIAFGATGTPLEGLLLASSNVSQRPVVDGAASTASLLCRRSDGRETFNRVWVTLNHTDQNRSLGIRTGSALFPVFKCAFVSAQVSGEYGS